MSKKYEMELEATVVFSISVEADSEQEAREKAFNLAVYPDGFEEDMNWSVENIEPIQLENVVEVKE